MRGRPRKQLLAENADTAIIKANSQPTPEVYELPVSQISDSERAILEKCMKQVAGIGSKLALIDREIDKINEALRRDSLRQKLKELKKEYKTYSQLHRDASNKMNGVLEIALRDFEGATLEDKILNVKALNA